MNLLIINDEDIIAPGKGRIFAGDRRFKHLSSILQAKQGSHLKIGVLKDKIGRAKVIASSSEFIDFEFSLTEKAPIPLPIKLVIALPRPKVVLRILQTATTMGVKEIFLVNAYRVEKDFWSCEQLKDEAIKKALLLGLEQARDTMMPKVYLERRLKPFVEDRISTISEGTTRFVAHPSPDSKELKLVSGPATVVIGPEGGFIPYEIEMFRAQGFSCVSLGARILKSETAMVAALARIQIS